MEWANSHAVSAFSIQVSASCFHCVLSPEKKLGMLLSFAAETLLIAQVLHPACSAPPWSAKSDKPCPFPSLQETPWCGYAEINPETLLLHQKFGRERLCG